jgi:hypothetical protein
MDTHDSTTDDVADEDAYRERAITLLDELAHRARVALRSANIPLNVYFIVPQSGDAILTCGAAANKEQWQEIKATVGSIVRHSIGLEPRRCREVICAMADIDDATA